MKATKLTYVLAAVLALTMIATGCQKRPTGITPLKYRDQIVHQPTIDPNLPPVDPSIDPNRNTIGHELTPEEWINQKNYTEDPTALAAHIVHFDYDSSVIKSSEKANVSAVAGYLKSNSDVGLRVDGHCDERGTEGYNDALGERRASALREALIAEGVNPNLVITQSFGERKPVATGHDESAYAQNRRGEFIVLHKK